MKDLIVVDMQNDFITGAFANPDAQKIVPDMAKFIQKWKGRITFTLDTHEEDTYKATIEGKNLPMHCERYTYGHLVEESLFEASRGKDRAFVRKTSFGSIESLPDALERELRYPSEITIIGVCTDICVVSNALILRAKFPTVPIKVIASLCAGTTAENHEAALKVMRSCQIEVVE